MWVVKLGGSLAYSAQLQYWLDVLAKASSVVIVPGGGPFADQVRRAQNHWGFDESSAHSMALLAMEQFGRMLCGMQSGLVAAVTESDIRGMSERGETPVWMPSKRVMAESAIAHGWDVTSDSLACWLCGQLGADRLLLVKSVPLTRESAGVEMLIEQGIVDAEFGRYLEAADVPAWLLSERDYDCVGALLGGNPDAATPIIPQRFRVTPSTAV